MSLRARPAMIAAVALSGVVSLSACGGEEGAQATEATDEAEQAVDDGAEETQEAEEEPAAQLDSGAAAVLTQVPDVDFTEVEQDDSTLISHFDKTITVVRTHQAEAVPADLAEQILPENLAGEADAGEATEVSAAEGEKLVFAVVRADDPRWEPVDAQLDGGEETTTAVRVSGNEVSELQLSLSAGDQTTLVISVPEELGAEEVVLETRSADASQEISLIDGARTSSDVEHIYARPTEVEIDDDASWSQDVETRRGVITHSGQANEGVISPMVPSFGWANPGNVFLGLNLSTRELEFPHIDNTTIRLQLADGSTVQPQAEPSGPDGPFSSTAWFQLPADAQEATAEVTVETQLGGDHHEAAVVEIPLTFTGDAEDDQDEDTGDSAEGSAADRDEDSDAEEE